MRSTLRARFHVVGLASGVEGFLVSAALAFAALAPAEEVAVMETVQWRQWEKRQIVDCCCDD